MPVFFSDDFISKLSFNHDYIIIENGARQTLPTEVRGVGKLRQDQDKKERDKGHYNEPQ